MLHTKNTLNMSVLIALTLALLACGGGGSGSNTTVAAPSAPSTPGLSLTPQAIKTLRFDWSDVASETEYRLLENPDASSGYTTVVTLVADSNQYDYVTSLADHINASYILQACNNAGCADSSPVFVSGSLINAVGFTKASNAGTLDNFGWSVALAADGNTLAVGAPEEASNATGIDGNQSDNSANASGAVYIFTRNGSSWSQQAYVKASNTEANDSFGHSITLAADGNTLVVGAPFEDSNATGIGGNQSDNSESASGAAYVFTRSGSNWSQQAYVKAYNTDASDQFGHSVALAADGNTLTIGASLEDNSGTGIINGFPGFPNADNAATNSGSVYVFTRSGNNWSQQAYIATLKYSF